MPELPEVETVRKVLKKNLIGLKIKKVFVYYDKIIQTNLEEFQEKLVDQTFRDIKRYGKWLVFELDNYALVSHLRMEGKYYYTNRKENEKHEHVVFYLDNGMYLRYKDVRKFGVMYLVSKDKIFMDTPLKKIGLEPFDDKLTINYLQTKFSKLKVPIKTALLDQEIIAGLGNIYADEVLFKSLISPFKKANSLNDLECEKIIKASKSILQEAINLGGTTIRSYTSSLGVTGSYQDKLLIHTRKNCPLCKRKVSIKKIGGRSTYYCLECQQVQDE